MFGGDSRLALGCGLFRPAVNWGLRSPNSDANNAYNVNTGGTLNNNNVYNANFAARPALMELLCTSTPQGGKQRPIIKGGHILSFTGAPGRDKHNGSDADRLVTGGKALDTPCQGEILAAISVCQACAAPSIPE